MEMKHNAVYRNPKTNEYVVLFKAPKANGAVIMPDSWACFNLTNDIHCI